jgi:peptide chain release factor 3
LPTPRILLQVMISPETPLAAAVEKRRTFAIISHPDAGKTTLTEKLLLYGGAITTAGQVSARRRARQVTSDWMELERERGISITSTVLQFPYRGHTLNLLDTPGHQDFGEDTYRTLLAADSAIMLIDAAKGVEPQTKKLFAICRARRIPLFTFVNKMDRPSRDPLELLDELEKVLGIATYPINWPIGSGPTFRGVYDRRSHDVHLFERTEHGSKRAPVRVTGLDDPQFAALTDESTYREFRDGLDLLEGAGAAFDRASLMTGDLPRSLSRISSAAARSSRASRGRHRAGARSADVGTILRIRFQDPSQHGSATSRPDRVLARVQRKIRTRHDRAQRAHR